MTTLNSNPMGHNMVVRPEVYNILLNAQKALGDGGIVDLGLTTGQFSCHVYLGGKIATQYIVKMKGSIDGTRFMDLGTATITTTEKVTNGTFTGNAGSWTLGAGWAYGSNAVGKTSGVGTMVQAVASMASLPVIGETYLINFEMTAWTKGSPTVTMGGATGVGKVVTATGVYAVELTAVNATGDLTFTPAATDDAYTVDNVSCVRNEDGFQVIEKPVRYIRGSIVSITGGDSSTSVTMACMAGGN